MTGVCMYVCGVHVVWARAFVCGVCGGACVHLCICMVCGGVRMCAFVYVWGTCVATEKQRESGPLRL